MATTFKVGDKFKVPTKGWWTEEKNYAHKNDLTLTVEKIIPSGTPHDEIHTTVNGKDIYFFEREITKVEDKMNQTPLQRTIAEIDAKLTQAVADQAQARKDRYAAREAVEEAQRVAKVAIRKAKASERKADNLIIEYGDMIVKLKELEPKPEHKIKVGNHVKVIDAHPHFPRQYGIVEAVIQDRVLVRGTFYSLDAGIPYPTYTFNAEELVVVR